MDIQWHHTSYPVRREDLLDYDFGPLCSILSELTGYKALVVLGSKCPDDIGEDLWISFLRRDETGELVKGEPAFSLAFGKEGLMKFRMTTFRTPHANIEGFANSKKIQQDLYTREPKKEL